MINICIIDSMSLKGEAMRAIVDSELEVPSLFMTNERASKYAVRGRSIGKVYLFGMCERNLDPVLKDSIQVASATSPDFKFIEVV